MESRFKSLLFDNRRWNQLAVVNKNLVLNRKKNQRNDRNQHNRIGNSAFVITIIVAIIQREKVSEYQK